MGIAVWDDSYLTGNSVVDTQHKHLFHMVNELHDAIVAGKGTAVLTPTLTELAQYTIQHFRSEEDLMVAAGYPARAAHQKKHEDLTRQVKDLVAKYQSGQCVLTITLSNFLADWLRHHIKEDDKALVQYLKAHPVGAAAAH